MCLIESTGDNPGFYFCSAAALRLSVAVDESATTLPHLLLCTTYQQVVHAGVFVGLGDGTLQTVLGPSRMAVKHAGAGWASALVLLGGGGRYDWGWVLGWGWGCCFLHSTIAGQQKLVPCL